MGCGETLSPRPANIPIGSSGAVLRSYEPDSVQANPTFAGNAVR